VDSADTASLVMDLSILAIVVGLVGIVVPVLPGLLLCWGGVLLWSLFGSAGWGRWAVLAVATGLLVAGTVIKYALPGRNLKRAGVPNRALSAGGVLGIVGFFVLPVVGLFVGFVLGVWLAEQVRLRDAGAAWTSTKHALKATGLSMLVELTAGVGMAVVFAAGATLA
jgi:uncharacterized protein YqgC (DUF456 family)